MVLVMKLRKSKISWYRQEQLIEHFIAVGRSTEPILIMVGFSTEPILIKTYTEI